MSQRQKDNISISNKISEIWEFYFKIWRNQMREILTGQNLQLASQFCFTTVIVAAHYYIIILCPALIFNFPALVPRSS